MAVKGSHKKVNQKVYDGPTKIQFISDGDIVTFDRFIPSNDHVKYDRIFFKYTKVIELSVRGKILSGKKIGQELMLTAEQLKNLIRKQHAIAL